MQIWLILAIYEGCQRFPPGDRGSAAQAPSFPSEVPAGATARAAAEPTPKQSVVGSMASSEDPARPQKRVKMTLGRHKSWRGEGGSQSHLKGKEPTASRGESTLPEYRRQWGALKSSSCIWQDGVAVAKFERGVLHPQLAKELYAFPSEVLIDRAAKAMV
ncbi:hypothetical protein BHE74_00012542 [Ensete ventricosum]|nr:hypothetical protein GW17_00041266 [Ensete ventricosum]RWW79187.1 hypothetical protein BHE74_00012542 [Ensete ventricosum]